MKPIFDILTEIADRHLNIPTLQERRSDSLDFHDVSVWGVKDALWYAYQAGINASAEKPHPIQKQLTSSGLFHTPGLFRALQNDYGIKGEPRRRAIRIFSEGYGLSRKEAAGLLSGDIPSEIDDAAGTITFAGQCKALPAGSHPGGKPYSVLLLYPDYANDGGMETYYAFVTAADPIEAVAVAQRQAMAAQEGVIFPPDDFAPLLVTQGHHDGEPLFNK
jgi:hypothetical protein